MQTPSNPIRPSRIRLGDLRLSPAASLRLALPAALLGLSSPALLAADGTWAAAADGLWSDTANWTSATVADGTGFGANFSTLDPTFDLFVALDGPRTLSSLNFGDTDPLTPAGWQVNSNGDPLNILTLDGISTVTVGTLGSDVSVEISAQIAGTGGLVKEGPGRLLASGPKSYTGATAVNGGTLAIATAAAVDSTYTTAAGATLEFTGATFSIPGATFTGAGTLLKTGAGNLGLGFSAGGAVNVDLPADALIRVAAGTLSGSSYNKGVWTNNLADLQIDAGATFDTVENDAIVDAVTGAGNLTGNYFGDPAKIVVGAAGGSGTFSGALYDSRGVAFGLTKVGAGTQNFSGSANHSGTTAVNAGVLSLPSFSNSPLYSIAEGATLEINCATNQDRNIKNVLINGGGNFVKKGPGLLRVNRWQNEADRSYQLSLAGTSEIRVEAGELLLGDYNINWNTSANLADLHIEAGAIVDGHTAGMTVDALTGGGTYESGYYGPRALNVGVNNGSGTFSGTIKGNGLDGNSQTQFIKRGNGTQTITGKFNAGGAYGGSSLEVRGGIAETPAPWS
jgi:autotransporter-associated beta strand protein